MPPTVRTLAIFDSAGPPCQRSIASVRARRTRGSSNGFLLWFGVTRLPQFQSLSCTVISPSSARLSSSRLRTFELQDVESGVVVGEVHHALGIDEAVGRLDDLSVGRNHRPGIDGRR
jgi:hypothetical protein